MNEYFIKFIVFSSGLNFALSIENSIQNLKNLLKEIKDMEITNLTKIHQEKNKENYFLIPLTITKGIYNSFNNIIFSSYYKTPFFNFNNKEKSMIINTPKCTVINPHKYFPEKLSTFFSYMINSYYYISNKFQNIYKIIKSNSLAQLRGKYDFFLPGDSIIALVKGENIVSYENENYVISPYVMINGNKYVFLQYIKDAILNFETYRYLITFPLISFTFCCIWKEINSKLTKKIKIIKINENGIDICHKCKKYKSQVIFKGCNHCVLCYLCFRNFQKYCPICKINNPDYIILIE